MSDFLEKNTFSVITDGSILRRFQIFIVALNFDSDELIFNFLKINLKLFFRSCGSRIWATMRWNVARPWRKCTTGRRILFVDMIFINELRDHKMVHRMLIFPKFHINNYVN